MHRTSFFIGRLFANFVADDAADSSATDGSNRATASKNGTSNSASTGAYSRVLIL